MQKMIVLMGLCGCLAALTGCGSYSASALIEAAEILAQVQTQPLDSRRGVHTAVIAPGDKRR